MPVRRLRQGAPGQRALHDQSLPAFLLELAVDRVAEGRRQERDLGLRSRHGGADVEDDVVARAIFLEVKRVDATDPVVGHGEPQRYRPAGIADVVVMEMDRGPLARILGPAM